MKKFVVVMITILVLFVFLMLNYLLWDKENLLKQSESDKIEQDWLRGQNRTLQSTVNEHEQTIKALEKENDELSAKVKGLEQELGQLKAVAEGYRKEIAIKDLAIDSYKMFTEDKLCELTQEWFACINQRDYDAAWKFMASDYLMFGRYYDQEGFKAYLEAIRSIALSRNADAAAEGRKTGEGQNASAGFSFEIRRNYGSTYEVAAVMQADVAINEARAGEIPELVQGPNRLQLTFRFNPEDREWAIQDLSKSNE